MLVLVEDAAEAVVSGSGAVCHLAQSGESVELEVAPSQDQAGGVGDGRHVHASLGQDRASGEGLTGRRPGAGPVHESGQEDAGIQVQAGLGIGLAGDVQDPATGVRPSDSGTAQNWPASSRAIDRGSNGYLT